MVRVDTFDSLVMLFEIIMLINCSITKTVNEQTAKEDSISAQLKLKDVLVRKGGVIDTNFYLQHLNN